MTSIPSTPRDFAASVVRTLVDAGYTALWAGGCVRDELLGKTPKDYDVATSATPNQVVSLFGKRRTVPVGASFGVIMVLGPSKACGQIEVATFRSDGEYLDGRRPESVQFCSPEEDALRRDFTINGMFYDPIAEELRDYVGGQEDLQKQVVRAIGDPAERFAEDKLRMLRAVRFTATFGFDLEESTAVAIRDQKSQLVQVSVERIAAEFRRMMSHESRALALSLLDSTELLPVLFPNSDLTEQRSFYQSALVALREPSFEPSFALLFSALFDASGRHRRDRANQVQAACRAWKLSNDETECVCWILESCWECSQHDKLPLHLMKPLLADDRHKLAIDYMKAQAAAEGQEPDAALQLVGYRDAVNEEVLDPPPLITGQDLMQMGGAPGPQFAQMIADVRKQQLDEVISTKDEALRYVSERYPFP